MSRPLLVLRPIAAVVLLVAVAGSLVWSAALPAVAAAGTGDTEAVIARRFAEARAQAGLPAVARSSELDAVARDWARRQAADGQMKHNPQLRDQVQPARAWYENVGYLRGVPSSRTYGEAGERLHQMWMDSDGHRANILRTPLTDVGIGVAASGDEVYATVVFRDRGEDEAGAEAEPARSPEPSPEPSSEPSPRARPERAKAASSAPAPAPAPSPSEPPPAPGEEAPTPPATEAAPSDELAASDASTEPATDGPARRAPAELALDLERRSGVPHDDAEAELDDGGAPAVGARPPVELLVAPDDTVELPVGEDGTRAVPLVFGLTTVAAAVVVGAGRSRRGGR